MPEALAVNWREVRSAVESGLPYLKAADAFGVPANAIRQRAFRENWVTASKVEALVKERRNTEAVIKCNTAALIADDLASRQENHRETVHRVTKKLWRSVESSPPTVETVTDLEKLQKITRLNLEMVSDQSAVQVNVWGNGTGGQCNMHDVEVVEIESQDEWI